MTAFIRLLLGLASPPMPHLMLPPRRTHCRTLPIPTTVTTLGVSFGSGGQPRTVIPRQLGKTTSLRSTLGVSQATLHATEEEASTARERLAESDAMVVGKMDSKNIFTLISTVFILIVLLFLRSPVLTVQLESLQLAANVTTATINAWGPLTNAYLHNIPANVQEIALHGIRHGASVALAAV